MRPEKVVCIFVNSFLLCCAVEFDSLMRSRRRSSREDIQTVSERPSSVALHLIAVYKDVLHANDEQR